MESSTEHVEENTPVVIEILPRVPAITPTDAHQDRNLSFPFTQLPAELQIKIWEETLAHPKVLECRYPPDGPAFHYVPEQPIASRICRLSREIALKSTVKYAPWRTASSRPPWYYNPEVDIVYFSLENTGWYNVDFFIESRQAARTRNVGLISMLLTPKETILRTMEVLSLLFPGFRTLYGFLPLLEGEERRYGFSNTEIKSYGPIRLLGRPSNDHKLNGTASVPSQFKTVGEWVEAAKWAASLHKGTEFIPILFTRQGKHEGTGEEQVTSSSS